MQAHTYVFTNEMTPANVIVALPRAYSYIRFSTKRQGRGDSLRRQLERSRRYAAENNLDFQEATYEDLGISAFDRSNPGTPQPGRQFLIPDGLKIGSCWTHAASDVPDRYAVRGEGSALHFATGTGGPFFAWAKDSSRLLPPCCGPVGGALHMGQRLNALLRRRRHLKTPR